MSYLEDERYSEPNVLLTRLHSPRFFTGVIPRTTRPVWSDDPRRAKFVSSHLIEQYEESLGEMLFPVWYIR